MDSMAARLCGMTWAGLERFMSLRSVASQLTEHSNATASVATDPSLR